MIDMEDIYDELEDVRLEDNEYAYCERNKNPILCEKFPDFGSGCEFRAIYIPRSIEYRDKQNSKQEIEFLRLNESPGMK